MENRRRVNGTFASGPSQFTNEGCVDHCDNPQKAKCNPCAAIYQRARARARGVPIKKASPYRNFGCEIHAVNKQNSCRACHASYKVAKKFGISPSQYEEMYARQGGRCLICHLHSDDNMKRLDNVKRLAVDHDHKTGEVRGLLCSLCNASLGGFKDDVTILQSAIEYLSIR